MDNNITAITVKGMDENFYFTEKQPEASEMAKAVNQTIFDNLTITNTSLIHNPIPVIGMDESFTIKRITKNLALKEECRICLKKKAFIPIFGEEDLDLSLDIMHFTNVSIKKDDDFSKTMCDECYKLLESAVLLRETARQTDMILKKSRLRIKLKSKQLLLKLQRKLDASSEGSETSTEFSILQPKTEPESSFKYNSAQLGKLQLSVENGSNELTTTQSTFKVPTEEMIKHTVENIKIELDPWDHPQSPFPGTNEEAGSWEHLELANMQHHIDTEKLKMELKVPMDIVPEAKVTFNCDLCKVNCESLEQQEKHMASKAHKTKAKKKYVGMEVIPDCSIGLNCKVCAVEFETLEQYGIHMASEEHKQTKAKTKAERKKYHCKLCNITLTKYYYFKHMDLKHNDIRLKKPKTKCNICQKNICIDHMLRHTKEKHHTATELQCPICNEIFKIPLYKEHYRSHVGYSLENPNELRYVCDQCGNRFKTSSALRHHVQIHSDALDFKCEYCPYRGRNKDLLKIHVRSHTKDYPYQCTECDVRCITKSNLNRHMKTHKGPDLICETCRKRFYSQPDLDRHIAVAHFGIKDQICNMCGAAFGYRKSLMRHTLKVHKRAKGVGRGKAVYLRQQEEQQQEQEHSVIPNEWLNRNISQ